MSDMLATRDRSGMSVALYVMLEAPSNAESMEIHRMSPPLVYRQQFFGICVVVKIQPRKVSGYADGVYSGVVEYVFLIPGDTGPI